MFASKRGMFSAEFKHGAVEQTKQHGVSCAQVARTLGIRENPMLTRTQEPAPPLDQPDPFKSVQNRRFNPTTHIAEMLE